MEYVVTNGQHCLYINNKGEIKGTNLKQAKRFMSEETAVAFLSNVHERFKTFCVVPATQKELQKIKQAREAALIQKQFSTSTSTKRCPIDPMIRKYIYRQSSGKCALCGNPVKYTDFTIDHIVPLSMGGENDIDNFQCTCRACNQFKSNILPEDFIQRVSDIYKHNVEKTHKRGFKRSIVKGILSLIE